MSKEVREVSSWVRLLNCPILKSPSAPTKSKSKRCTKAETNNLMDTTIAFKEVIFNSKLLLIKSGIFN